MNKGEPPGGGLSPSAQPDAAVDWDSLSDARQLELREAYGHYLDTLPPTCSLETKIERFRRWLEERGIRYTGEE